MSSCLSFCGKLSSSSSRATGWLRCHWALRSVRCVSTKEEKNARVVTLKNGSDSLVISRIINGMWQTSGGWGTIDSGAAVEAMLSHADAGLTSFDMSNHYGPAEDLYGFFINRVRRERPPEFLEEIKGLTKWVPSPVKMTSNYVRDSINTSLKRMDVASLDMLQFHWWDYSNSGYLDALKHLADLKEEGKIKTLGLTNFDTERLQIILENGIPIVSNQVQHSVIGMRPQQKMAELCRLNGVKLITYGTVMGGLLSEKFLDVDSSSPSSGPTLNTPSLLRGSTSRQPSFSCPKCCRSALVLLDSFSHLSSRSGQLQIQPELDQAEMCRRRLGWWSAWMDLRPNWQQLVIGWVRWWILLASGKLSVRPGG